MKSQNPNIKIQKIVTTKFTPLEVNEIATRLIYSKKGGKCCFGSPLVSNGVHEGTQRIKTVVDYPCLFFQNPQLVTRNTQL